MSAAVKDAGQAGAAIAQATPIMLNSAVTNRIDASPRFSLARLGGGRGRRGLARALALSET
jgi:hypothetical protein